jgi:hypothetical protein
MDDGVAAIVDDVDVDAASFVAVSLSACASVFTSAAVADSLVE